MHIINLNSTQAISRRCVTSKFLIQPVVKYAMKTLPCFQILLVVSLVSFVQDYEKIFCNYIYLIICVWTGASKSSNNFTSLTMYKFFFSNVSTMQLYEVYRVRFIWASRFLHLLFQLQSFTSRHQRVSMNILPESMPFSFHRYNISPFYGTFDFILHSPQFQPQSLQFPSTSSASLFNIIQGNFPAITFEVIESDRNIFY